MTIEKTESLKRASKYHFSTGLGDGASGLCLENMRYGLAKIHIVQEQFGLDPDATFVSTPDETVTRNITRWKAGFGYGGKLVWGSGKEKLIILDTKPNVCGMLVGGLNELPEVHRLIERINDAKKLYINGIKIDWRFCKGNHFINVLKVLPQSSDLDLPEYAFIIHGSASELKGETEKGLGLYFNRSPTLRERSTTVKTKFGPVHVLIDNDAEDYFKFYKYAEFFSKKRRKMVAEAVFDEFSEICNVTHQGLLNYNEHILGCQNTQDPNASLFPIALRADLPAFLMKGFDNLDDEIIKASGFKNRAEKLGVIGRLRNANILPHGGGYAFNDLLNVDEVIETDGERYFVLDMKTGIGKKICSNVRDLQFQYRGASVVSKSISLRLGEVIARLIPHYSLKI